MLMQMLERAAAESPAKDAIVQGEQRISYQQLLQQTLSLSAGLQGCGVGHGGCVAVILPNCAEFVLSLFACARLRAVLMPLNPHYTNDELMRFIQDGAPQVIITDSLRAPLCKKIIESLALVTQVVVIDADASESILFSKLLTSDPIEVGSSRPEDKALYLYTSGSTSEYKRLCSTQENLYYEALNFVETLGLSADDAILCTVPLYHSYGLGNGLLDAVYSGSTLVLLAPVIEGDKAIDVPFVSRIPHIIELIKAENIRFLPAVPYQFSALAQSEHFSADDLAGLKWCVSSGDVLTETTYQQFLERYDLAIRSLYGSTEAGSICIDTSDTDAMQFGSLGEALKNVEIQIRDHSGERLANGNDGVIWVKSPVIPPSGYDNRPELSEVTFVDGFYDTGDMGQLDESNHLKMTGRKQTFVDVSGYKVDISEVEEVLRSHPNVSDAAALGIHTEYAGNIIKAVVVTNTDCQGAEIQQFCREHLAQFKIPRVVEFMQALPRSPLGKVLKKELQTLPEEMMIPSLAEELRSLGDVTDKQRFQFVAKQIHDQVIATLQLDHQQPAAQTIAYEQSFQSLGFDSISSVELQSRLSLLSGLPLAITLLWNHPSISALAKAILEKLGESQMTIDTQSTAHVDYASSSNTPEHEFAEWSDDDVDSFFERRIAASAGAR